ncbi:MAG: glycosyltransferase [Flavobacteriaceae bacterium]
MPLCIIVPCFNEANRFPKKQFNDFLLSHPTVQLLCVDDGSTDETLQVLNALATIFPTQLKVLSLEQNTGKAGAVQAGMLFALKSTSCTRFAYLDADLSTSLKECVLLAEKIDEKTTFVFGSRILKTDNRIERKWYRFLIGRVIATVISKMLGISVYDTQCGCKIFDRKLVPLAFEADFSSRWLFDVEIFFRLINTFGKKELIKQSQEVPLEQWIDTEDSRVKFSYMFQLWVDLALIYRRYKQ